MRTTIHRNEQNPTENFTETTTGETPNSVEVSTNAKGHAQITIKAYFTDPYTMQTEIEAVLVNTIANVKSALTRQGIPLAGEGSAK